jgi:hypothetical protein
MSARIGPAHRAADPVRQARLGDLELDVRDNPSTAS